MGIHVVVRLPSCFFAMIAIVDDTHTTVDMVADCCSRRGGIIAYTGIILIYGRIAEIQQVGTEVLDMLIIIFIVMASVTCRSANAQAVLAPCIIGGEFFLVGDGTVDLGGHLGCTAGRETTDENVIVNVVSYNLSVRVVAFAFISRGSSIGITWNLGYVADEQHMGQVVVGVVLGLDIALNG